jgi:recombinational DNA repair protein RecT
MKVYSTRVAAGRLGIHFTTLAQYVAVGKVPSPNMVATGRTTTHLWTEEEIEAVRKLLPKIANGRKTRWQRSRNKQEKTAQAGAPVLHRSRKARKKK